MLEAVAETSKNARKIFLAMLLGCVYSLLTIATTTDARLLTNSASSPLPIIQAEIPIAWFYCAAPFALLGFYVYLHFYLGMLWEGLAGLPAKFPDGKRLDERAYPWLLNGLVRRHFARLKEGRPFLVRFKEWTTIFLAWWTVPATLFWFWLRYLRRHEWGRHRAARCAHGSRGCSGDHVLSLRGANLARSRTSAVWVEDNLVEPKNLSSSRYSSHTFGAFLRGDQRVSGR